MAVYAEHGPPPFVSLGIFIGWKPAAKPDAYSTQDFANVLSAFAGGEMRPPPPGMGG